MRILLLCSALNGLTRRAWCAIERAGHDVVVQVTDGTDQMREAVQGHRPELIVCPFLTAKVPQDIWRGHRTIIIHPGPPGDRGSSSLDWAITEGARRWGVTALQAVEEMDAGPIWASRTFDLPDPAPRKSAVYNGPVADAAMACIEEVLTKAADPSFVPIPLEDAERPVPSARLRPRMRRSDRAIDWDAPTAQLVRRIRAADGSPGLQLELGGRLVYAYDVAPAQPWELQGHQSSGPGDILCHRAGAVHVRTGDGSVWVGHLRAVQEPDGPATIKLPATTVLSDMLGSVPCPREHPEQASRQIRYHQQGEVGWLSFDFYNGAMSTQQCWALLAALRRALAQETKVLVLRGSMEVFSTGIHLNVIDAAADPAAEAWANIKAMNSVCKEILSAQSHTVISAFTGSAGAGGVMLGLGADVVTARAGVVLDPYYDIGLYGSELHSLVLPLRTGEETAHRLLEEKRPIDADQAEALGLVDAVGPRDPVAFEQWLGEVATFHAAFGRPVSDQHPGRLPLDAIEARELAEMSRDMFEDRSGFSAERRAFVHKLPRAAVPLQV